MPCLNEVEALGDCIQNAIRFLADQRMRGEVIVVDNGSTDGSVAVAQAEHVTIVQEAERGYGNACRKGLSVAQGDFIFLLDADSSYDLREGAAFIAALRSGYDLVVGTRLKGDVAPGSMPWLHRYIGIPFLTWLLNVISGCEISDAHCGLRAIKRSALDRLRLQTTGMEFASEIILEASCRQLSVTELPIGYYPRRGKSKLKTYRDGIRHLRLLLSYTLSVRCDPPRGILDRERG